MLWGTFIPAALLVALVVWRFESPPAVDASRPEQQSQATGERTNQGAGESTVGRAQPQRQEDSGGGKAQDIQQTANKLSLNDEQRGRVRSFLSQHRDQKKAEANFTVSIGSVVPPQAQLAPLPEELSSVIQGYAGSDYTVVGDQLILVDRQTRRIVAIVPGVA
jgi:hypothetical protein